MSDAEEKDDSICCRCNEAIEIWQGMGWIDGERAHASCVILEMDEYGMDDFHGDN